jgi:hypothetical protein
MKRHHQILNQATRYMDEEVLTVADELYDFQYGSDEHCHQSENLELRPLFTRLNDNYADWQRAKTAYLTGDYSVDPLKVMRQYRKTFAKFNRAFINIGFADDFPELHKRRMDATLLLFGRAELLGIIYGTNKKQK